MSNIINDYSALLERLQLQLGIRFKNQELLFRCLVHDSFLYENNEIGLSNERLEFLGDSVIGLVISHLLFKLHPNWNEGEMALYKSKLVSAECLAEKARSMELGQFLFLGRGEEASGGRLRTSILSDTLEAFIGAYYLDQGFESTFNFIEELYNDSLDEAAPSKDFKSCLQEYSQKQFKSLPRYAVIDEFGPPHQKIFKVRVRLQDQLEGLGEGSSKKEAEQKAAEDILKKIYNN